ncbi:MAG: hypothetical protein WDO74_25375 [Pseudomonadota bacterium]
MAKDPRPSRPRRSARFFLNVDLEVESTHGLSALIEALEPTAYSVERPPGRACFELNSAIAPRSPEPLIRKFARLIADLPPAARKEWQSASKRVFDIGMQSRRVPFQEAHRLTPETLSAVLAIGAELAITIYALAPEDDARPG